MLLLLLLQTELSHNLQQLSEKARSTTEFIQRLKGMSDKVTVSNKRKKSLFCACQRRINISKLIKFLAQVWFPSLLYSKSLEIAVQIEKVLWNFDLSSEQFFEKKIKPNKYSTSKEDLKNRPDNDAECSVSKVCHFMRYFAFIDRTPRLQTKF